MCTGMAAIRGSTITGEVFAWVVVFLLPLNSAINPILYTLSALKHKKKNTDTNFDRVTSETYYKG